MKRRPQCVKCKLADWKRTASGRLHPSGDGINRKDDWKQCSQFQKAES